MIVVAANRFFAGRCFVLDAVEKRPSLGRRHLQLLADAQVLIDDVSADDELIQPALRKEQESVAVHIKNAYKAVDAANEMEEKAINMFMSAINWKQVEIE